MRLTSALLVPIFLAGCGQSDQTVSYKDSEGKTQSLDVSGTGDTRTVESKDGFFKGTGTQGASKARFPDYAPAYPGATVQSSVDMEVGGKKMHNINQLSSDKPEQIFAFYVEKAKAAGQPVKQMPGNILGIGKPAIAGMPENMITVTPSASGSSIAMMLVSQ